MNTDTHRSKKMWRNPGNQWSTTSQGNMPGIDPCLEFLRRNQPCSHLDFDLCSLQNYEKINLVCLNHSVCSTLSCKPSKQVYWLVVKVKVLITQSCLTLCDPRDCSPPGSSVHRIFPGKNTGVGCYFPPPGDHPHPGIEPNSPGSPALQAESLPAEALGKPCVEISLALSPECHFLTYPCNLLIEWMNGSINCMGGEVTLRTES